MRALLLWIAIGAPVLAAGCHQIDLATGGVNADINSGNFIAVAAHAYYAGVWPLPLGQLGEDIVTVDDTLQSPTSHNISYPCESGLGRIAWTDTDGDGTVSTGDGLVMDFTACTMRGALGEVSYTGRLAMSQFHLAGTPLGSPLQPWDFKTTFTATNLSATQNNRTRVFNGSFDFEAKSTPSNLEAVTITGQQLTGTAGAQTDTLSDFTLSEQVDRRNIVYNGRDLAATLDSAAYGTLDVATVTPFQGALYFDPQTGAMTVTAADKTNLKMTSNTVADVTLDLDSSGDGIYDETQNVAWSVIAGQGRF